jgi:hypothetical protein
MPRQERERSYIYGFGVSIFASVYDFYIGFWNCFDSMAFFKFIFFLNVLYLATMLSVLLPLTTSDF